MLDYKKSGGSVLNSITPEQRLRKVQTSGKKKLTKENKQFLGLIKKILKN